MSNLQSSFIIPDLVFGFWFLVFPKEQIVELLFPMEHKHSDLSL